LKTDFYNREGEQNKEWFISQIKQEQRKIYVSLFNRAAQYEELIGKDILDFTNEECYGLLVSMRPKSIAGEEVFISQFKQYVNWGIENGKVPTMKNQWDNVTHSEGNNVIIAMYKRRYFKDINSLKEFITTVTNRKYDKLIIYLLYSGLSGFECEELRYAKDADLDIINKTIKVSVGKPRTVHLRDEVVNAYLSSDDDEYRKSPDENSPYLIKPFKGKNYTGGPALYGTVLRLVNTMNKLYFQATKYKTNYTPATIWKSGLYYQLYEIEKAKGKLDKSDYLKVCGIYNRNMSGEIIEEYRLYKKAFWE